MAETMIYIDGKYAKVAYSVVDAFTPGHFKADGVFETMLAIGHQVFETSAHLSRLRRGLKQMQIPFKSKDSLDLVIRRVVVANGFPMSRVRVLVWREGTTTHLAVMALQYVKPKKKIFRVCLVKTGIKADARLANVKSLDYACFMEAYDKAKAQGFDEALLLNRKGFIVEASRANIFWIKKNIIYTPPLSSGCLNGITRQLVIQESKRLNIGCVERNLTLALLKNADAAFITNSLLGVMPILTTPSLLSAKYLV